LRDAPEEPLRDRTNPCPVGFSGSHPCAIKIKKTKIPMIRLLSKISSITTNPLTQREQEILSLIAKGKTNQEIAEVLYITTGTVRVHVHAILHKLEVRDRSQAFIVAMQTGLIK
jgi:DNA-binding NarL/FixJ family response regulator